MKKIAFTIVLNGMPFITKQASILPKIFDEWHIIEGATLPLYDTGWCSPIMENFYTEEKLSIDGTTEFIDSIADDKKIFVHRKKDFGFWNGKVEMCNAIAPVMNNCVLMQFDVDEIWSLEILKDVLNYTCDDFYSDTYHGMMFKCNYYVGPGLVIQNENCYGNNPYEWMRLWKIKNHTSWISHEPPKIKGAKNFLSREFTKAKGWIFDHFAYTTESQVLFKENFYGYVGALDQWNKLQKNEKFPCFLRDYLPWVKDNAIVDKKIKYKNDSLLP